jgi:acyl-CoA reductase-like NAD-dependent aldehyde dehydrogenase
MRENYIGGGWSAHSGDRGDSVIDPATGDAYDEVAASTAEDVAAAVGGRGRRVPRPGRTPPRPIGRRH